VTATTLSSLVVILLVVAVGPVLADVLAPRVRVPGVVLEIGAGIWWDRSWAGRTTTRSSASWPISG
jgi:Kef-type K+ transport system membrane component KefB